MASKNRNKVTTLQQLQQRSEELKDAGYVAVRPDAFTPLKMAAVKSSPGTTTSTACSLPQPVCRQAVATQAVLQHVSKSPLSLDQVAARTWANQKA